MQECLKVGTVLEVQQEERRKEPVEDCHYVKERLLVQRKSRIAKAELTREQKRANLHLQEQRRSSWAIQRRKMRERERERVGSSLIAKRKRRRCNSVEEPTVQWLLQSINSRPLHFAIASFLPVGDG